MKESTAAVTVQVAGSDEEPRRSLRRSTALTIAGQMALVVIYTTKYFPLSTSVLPESSIVQVVFTQGMTQVMRHYSCKRCRIIYYQHVCKTMQELLFKGQS